MSFQVILYSYLSPQEKLLLMTLFDLQGEDDLSYAALALITGINKIRVIQCFMELEKKGILEVHRTKSEKGVCFPNKYKIHFEKIDTRKINRGA